MLQPASALQFRNQLENLPKSSHSRRLKMASGQQSTVTSEQENKYPEWINLLIEKEFAGKCLDHESESSNNLNRYCITCNSLNCRYCIQSGNHQNHQLLTIYRQSYSDAVPVIEMEKHMDCLKIQTYRNNKKLVLALKPLPSSASGALDANKACAICRRKLTNPDQFSFCSITCKVQSVSRRMSDEESAAPANEKRAKRSRKGVPCRAHF